QRQSCRSVALAIPVYFRWHIAVLLPNKQPIGKLRTAGIHGASSRTSEGNCMGVVELFQRGRSLYGERPCLVHGTTARTYREVDERVRRIASALLEAGLKPADRIAVYSPNSIAAFEAI